MRIRDRIKDFRRVKASRLAPNPRNWRFHPQAQQDALRGILAEVGIADALLARELPDGTLRLVDGHLRGDTAPDTEWPVLVLDIDDAEEAKLLATLDPLAAMAEADQQKLGELLASVETDNEALDAMLADLAAQEGIDLHEPGAEDQDPEPQIDRAAELQKEWGTELGQLWVVPGKAGEHRLLCGDYRVVDDMTRLCAGLVDGCFTSPPYAEQRKDQYGGTPADEYVEWWGAVQANVRAVLAKDGSFFVNIKSHCEGLDRSLYVLDLVVAMVRRWDWHYAEEFCWERSGIPQQVSRRFKNQFEPVYQFALGPWKIRPEQVRHHSDAVPVAMGAGRAGDTNAAKRQGIQSAVAENDVAPGLAYPGNRIRTPQAKAIGHPAVFPPGLPAFFIGAFSDPGDRWLDPFFGSGTTMVAAENLSRLCFGMEISPAYCAVILQRMKDLGLEPRLESEAT